MDPTAGQDHYAVLGVAEDATTEQIHAAYAYRLRLSHPDLYPGDAQVQRWVASLDAARSTLTDPDRRAEYDRHRGARRYAPALPNGTGGPSGAEPEPDAPAEVVQAGKVVLTADQARDGCDVQWVQDVPEGAFVRTLVIPPGVVADAVVEFPADVVDGAAFPALRLGIVIEAGGPEAAGPSVVSFQETTVERRRSPLPLGIAAAAVLAVAIGLGFVLGIGRGAPPPEPAAQGEKPAAASPAPTPTPAPTPSPSAPPVAVTNADELLADEVIASKAAVRALSAGVWLPQISSLCAGPQQADLVGQDDRMGYPDGRPEQYASLTEADILAFHQALNARLDGTAVLVEGTPTAVCRTPSRWVSLVSVAQPSSDAVAQWCSAQQLPAGSCVPTQLTAEELDAARYMRHGVSTATMDVPWFMAGEDAPGSTRFTDPDTGAVVRIQASEPGATVTTMAQAEAELDSQSSQPALARTEPNGFTLSGFTGSGDIYYWRQYATDAATVDVVWTYPAQARETFDAAVVRGVRTFQTTA